MILIVLLGFIIGHCWSAEISWEKSPPPNVVYYLYVPDVPRVLDRYENSAVNKFLQEEEVRKFFAPTFRKIEQFLDFWASQFQLNKETLREVIKDKLMVLVILVPKRNISEKTQAVRLIFFRPNQAPLNNWTKRFESSLPAQVKRQEIITDYVKLQSFHYFVKQPVDTTELFPDLKSKQKKVELPQIFREQELYLSYGNYKDYFLISMDKTALIKSILADKSILSFVESAPTLRAEETPQLQIFSNLSSHVYTGRIKNTLLQNFTKQFNLADTKLNVYFYPDEWQLRLSIAREDEKPINFFPVVDSSLKQTQKFRASEYIPPEAHYWGWLLLDWANLWSSFNENLPSISEPLDKYANVVLNNIEKNTTATLSGLFRNGLGNEVAFFPVYTSEAPLTATNSRLMLSISLKDEAYFSSFLRATLLLISRLSYFKLEERRHTDGTLFIFREERPYQYLTPRQLVFWTGKSLCLVTDTTTTLNVALTRFVAPPNDISAKFNLEERVPLIKKTEATPVLIIHWDRFDLSALLYEIQNIVSTLRIRTQEINSEVVDLQKKLQSSLFQKYFNSANLILLNHKEKTELIFQLGLK